ncbi:hypothetical protein ABZY36_37665 [Streptomyces sp. NPDC006627]|uniref:hypothetical protein n=1 Tax=Streptomyces sp. NPDC006627 TaxID=3154679 RepID=UPI0033B191F8
MHVIRGVLIPVAAVSCLLLTGCSEGKADKDNAGAEPSVIGSPVGKPIASPPATAPEDDENEGVPAPEAGAPFVEYVKEELRKRTVRMAHAPGKTSATCDKDTVKPVRDATITCTVTYEGLKVVWPVRFTGKPGFGGMGDGYEARPSTGLLTRAGVHRYWWGNHRNEDGGGDMRCDSMPRVWKAPLGQKTKYRCTYFAPKASVTGADMWITDSIVATEDGPRGQS